MPERVQLASKVSIRCWRTSARVIEGSTVGEVTRLVLCAVWMGTGSAAGGTIGRSADTGGMVDMGVIVGESSSSIATVLG